MKTQTKTRASKPVKKTKRAAKKTAKKTANKKTANKKTAEAKSVRKPAKAQTKPAKTKRSEEIVSIGNGNSKGIKVEFYKDVKGEARWRLVRRGRIIGASTEGYKRAASARSNFKGLREAMGMVHV